MYAEFDMPFTPESHRRRSIAATVLAGLAVLAVAGALTPDPHSDEPPDHPPGAGTRIIDGSTLIAPARPLPLSPVG